ncbi:MAG: TolC family protein [Bacteroidetes bacterium]|nr:TolC family protein [Bacteroidota bacterium]MBT5991477.1 TolC family protein [Bacteroidota bacterium]
MNYRYIILMLLFLFAQKLAAQNSMADILKHIETNNLSIQSAKLESEANSIQAKTGLLPENPTITYGYFPGNSPIMGVKELYTINQSLEFPTKYFSKFKLAGTNQEQSKTSFLLDRMNVLLHAKKLLCDYIYVSQSLLMISDRKENAETLLTLYEKQLQAGQVSIIAFNKIQSLYLLLYAKYEKTKQLQNDLQSELNSINGGKELDLDGLKYNSGEISSLDDLKKQYQSKHPELMLISLKLKSAAYDESIQKQEWLPDILLSYQSEFEPSGNYQGLQAGISIPLWHQSKKVQAAKANKLYIGSHLKENETRLIDELDRKYTKAESLKELIDTLEKSLSTTSNRMYLDKALESGEFSIIDYINELSFNYELIDLYLETQRIYYKLLAEIYSINL